MPATPSSTERAVDRSPCGTGASVRMAQLAARGRLAVGDSFGGKDGIKPLMLWKLPLRGTAPVA
ncbi:proline racemase family protein [Bradyrhizobium sp.]|uniref:proline racemase family protein n=1 Tax=Bradyrhizobium sp. TaxID=376 RepID=UPI0039C85871